MANRSDEAAFLFLKGDAVLELDETGHLEATGRDAKGRKQYRYHAQWARVRNETKYGRAVLFGEALTRIRKHVDTDLAHPSFSRERVLATIVKLLELTFIRVGNTKYARINNSFGLATLLDRHVQIAGATVLFRFRGKSGKTHEITLTNKRLAQRIKQCRDVPARNSFSMWMKAALAMPFARTMSMNICGPSRTAKDFRTWAGTLLASSALLDTHKAGTKLTKATTLRAVEAVAAQLGNTPAVCRKCYIHPAILKSFEDERLLNQFVKATSVKKRAAGLVGSESALLRFLKTSHAKSVVAIAVA